MGHDRLTTLCYIQRGEEYLMMHRVRKQHDVNHDKWIGVGGHFLEGETPDECVVRETYEETGLRLTQYHLRGLITFLSDQWQTEYMFLYTADGYEGDPDALPDCREGELRWISKRAVYELPIWEGDKVFFRILEEEGPFFQLKLRYEGDTLVECVRS